MRYGRTSEKLQCALCLREVGFGMTHSKRILVVGKATMHRFYKANGVKTNPAHNGVALKGTGYRYRRPQRSNALGIARMVRASHKRVARCLNRKRPAIPWMERYRTDPQFKVKHLLRKRIRKSIQEGYKSASTMALTGCTLIELTNHLASQFMPGMTWFNLGVGAGHWNIDHRVPCSWFDLTNPSQQRECFHYTNLQPLWSVDNLSKGNRHAGR